MKNPMFLAFLILVLSIMSANLIYKETTNSWLSFVLILTFSSGMMTLFIYTTSMTPNEKPKNKKFIFVFLISISISMTKIPFSFMLDTKETMKAFSSKLLIMVMASTLILSMLSISIYGHHPNQTISSSF